MLVPVSELARELKISYQAVLYQVKVAHGAFPNNFRLTKRLGKKFLASEDATRIRKYYRSKLSRHV